MRNLAVEFINFGDISKIEWKQEMEKKKNSELIWNSSLLCNQLIAHPLQNDDRKMTNTSQMFQFDIAITL